jgi:hypothetical protein
MYVKVNVDAALFEDAGMGAIVAVLRDDKSNFLAAQCKFIRNAAYVVTTEAMDMQDGLGLANSLGFNRVEAESDYLQVINNCIPDKLDGGIRQLQSLQSVWTFQQQLRRSFLGIVFVCLMNQRMY